NWLSMAEAVTVFLGIVFYIWWIRYYIHSFWIVMLAGILVSHAVRKETPRGLGFRWSNLTRSIRSLFPFVIIIAAVLLSLATQFQTIRRVPPYSALSSLVYYCFWGSFQQYLLNAYFVNRLLEFSPASTSQGVSLMAAGFFAGAHAPNWFLM